MNFQHVAIKAAKAGAHPGGLRGLVEYNARLRQDLLTQAVRYIERGDGYTYTQDFVDKGQAHVPDWAASTVDFFRKAEQYGRQNHSPAKVIEVALPRELSETARLALADAIRETYFSQHPHSWAIHNPTARDGGEQPHLHLMVSMRVDDGITRSHCWRASRSVIPTQAPVLRVRSAPWLAASGALAGVSVGAVPRRRWRRVLAPPVAQKGAQAGGGLGTAAKAVPRLTARGQAQGACRKEPAFQAMSVTLRDHRPLDMKQACAWCLRGGLPCRGRLGDVSQLSAASGSCR